MSLLLVFVSILLLPAASVFIAAGGVFQLWGGVSAVFQHIIGQVCEQFLQL